MRAGLSPIAFAHTSKQRHVALVPIPARLLAGHGRFRRDVEQHRDIGGRQRALARQLGRVTRRRAGIEFGDDFLDAHAAIGKGLAVQPHAGHGHDLPGLDLALVEGAVDHDVADVGVDHRHQVEGLHHVGAVVAAQ